jgi:hypothetical protein
MPFEGLLWFGLMLTPLALLQRLLHREIQAVFMLVTRNRQLAIALFSILFFPGVFLHELSHFLMAKLLGARTGKVSLIPAALPDGRLQLGYVEVARVDIVRDSLIGLAPLIAGSLFVAFAGISQMKLNVLWDVFKIQNYSLFFQGILLIPKIPDFYLWSYLIFAVSSVMLPSESDRHAWLPLGLWAGLLLALAVFVGAGKWMLENLAPLLDGFFSAAAILFGLSALLHVILLLPALLFHRILVKLTGVDIKY